MPREDPIIERTKGWRDAEFFMEFPIDRPIPQQGWKLHISSDVVSAVRIFDIVEPILRKENVEHKVMRNLSNLRKTNMDSQNPQIGKFITIYPESEKQAVRLAKKIDDALEDRGLTGPRIPTDKQYGTSGLVFYRYGGFVLGPLTKPDGTTEEDIRRPGHYKPDWITYDPFIESRVEEEEKDIIPEIPKVISKTSEIIKGVSSMAESENIRPALLSIICPYCGTKNKINALNCKSCGNHLGVIREGKVVHYSNVIPEYNFRKVEVSPEGFVTKLKKFVKSPVSGMRNLLGIKITPEDIEPIEEIQPSLPAQQQLQNQIQQLQQQLQQQPGPQTQQQIQQLQNQIQQLQQQLQQQQQQQIQQQQQPPQNAGRFFLMKTGRRVSSNIYIAFILLMLGIFCLVGTPFFGLPSFPYLAVAFFLFIIHIFLPSERDVKNWLIGD